MRIRRALPIVFVLAFSPLSGCATIINGSHQTIHVETDPAGATVTVLGERYTSPFDLVLPRRSDGVELVIDKAGYLPKTIPLARRTSASTWLNLLAVPAGAGIGAASTSSSSSDWFHVNQSASIAGGALVGGAVSGLGFAIDASSGAIHRFDPPAIAVRLEPEPPAPPPVATR
jgi:hypothetical protein